VKRIKVKDIMVPLGEYAKVNEDATLYEAVLELEEAQQRFRQDRYAHRAILVVNDSHNVVGKLSQLDIIIGLESGYEKIGDLKYVSHTGFTPDFIKSMMKEYSLWEKPLDDIIRKAAQTKVKDIMYTPTEADYVEEEASLDEAIHRLVVGHHQSLLVTKEEKIVGIFRLSDVFAEVCNLIKTCEV
jgi:CBS domain-containing protein